MTRLLLVLLVATPSYGPTTKNQTQISTGKAGAQWFNLPDCAPDGGVHLNYRLDGGFVCATAGGGAVSATPGGTYPQVQYNAGGTFGGAARVVIDGGNIGLLPMTANPAAPPAETEMLYSFQPATGVPSIPYGISSEMRQGMPLGLLNKFSLQGTATNWRTRCCYPGQALTSTAFTCDDTITPSTVGGSAGVDWDAGNLLGRNARYLYQTVSTVNTNVGLRAPQSFVHRGNSGDTGGFIHRFRFSFGTVAATVRVFQGLQFGTAATISNTLDPDSELNTFYLGRNADAGNGNCRIFSNDGTGLATMQADLGANFPCATSATGLYDVWFWSMPSDGGTGAIDYYVQRLDSAQTAQGSVTTDLPASYVLGNWQHMIGTSYVAASTAQLYLMMVCTAYGY